MNQNPHWKQLIWNWASIIFGNALYSLAVALFLEPGVTRPEMCRVTRPVRAGMGKRFRKRCRCPGKSRNTPPACRAETDKRGKDTWSTKYG